MLILVRPKPRPPSVQDLQMPVENATGNGFLNLMEQH